MLKYIQVNNLEDCFEVNVHDARVEYRQSWNLPKDRTLWQNGKSNF